MYQHSIRTRQAATPASAVMRSAKKPKKPLEEGGRSLKDLLPVAGIQTRRVINQPGDSYEKMADSMAERVMAMSNADVHRHGKAEDVPSRTQGLTVSRQSESEEGGGTAPPIVDDALRSPGQSLDSATRSFMEPRFGQDFSQVRIHTDSVAAESARAVNAAAYTVGKDIVFGAGYYSPSERQGQQLLAHELTHVVQQGGVETALQRTPLSTYSDKDPLHDPSRLTDAQIEATNEYKKYMNPKLVWQTQDKMTSAEALLACRLMLRYMREGKAVFWNTDGRKFMELSRNQLGTMTSAQGNVGKLNWVPFSSQTASVDPTLLQSDFGRWILAGEAEPDATSGDVNCWEMVMFSAYKGSYTTKKRIEGIYNEGVKQVKLGNRRSVGDTIEVELRSSKEYTLDTSNAKTPEPLPGDIIIFSTAANHVAISLGTKDGSGRHKIVSHWPPPDGSYKAKQTTIEELTATMSPAPVVKFWSPKW